MFNIVKNIGCLAVIAIAGVFFYSVYQSIEKIDSAAASAPERPRDKNAKPDNMVVELMFRKAVRDYMNDPDSYKPGSIRMGDHPDGFAYVHEFRGKNAFGAMIKDMCGLLFQTNSQSWTFYNKDQLPDLLKDVSQPETEREEVKPTKPAPTISHKRVEPTTRANNVDKTTEHIQAQSPSPTVSHEKPVEKPICSRCNGTGTIESKTRCMKCGGAGRIYVNGAWKSCPKTISAGRKPCPDCNR